MGRITVFSMDGCPHSQRVQDALESRNIPYKEISISLHPYKHRDMIHLCDRYSVPQVFFNTRHVGGADETIKVLKEWDNATTTSTGSPSRLDGPCNFSSARERYEFEIGSRPDPDGCNTRLMIPSTEAQEVETKMKAAEETTIKAATTNENGLLDDLVESYHLVADCSENGFEDYSISNPAENSFLGSFPAETSFLGSFQSIDSIGGEDLNSETYKFHGEGHCVILPDGKSVSILDMMERLKNMLPMKDIDHHQTSYTNCFTGKAAVKAIQFEYDVDEDRARLFCQQLYRQKILCYAFSVETKGINNNNARLNCRRRSLLLAARDGDVEQKREYFEFSDKYYFLLQCYQTPEILNSYCNCFQLDWIKDKRSISSLMKHLHSLMTKIQSAVISPKGKINYKNAPSNEAFPIFEESISHVQRVDPTALDDNYKGKMAFSLNLYNIMLKYAFMKIGIGNTRSTREALLEKVKFNVGGQIFSFREWFDIILRGGCHRSSSFRKLQLHRPNNIKGHITHNNNKGSMRNLLFSRRNDEKKKFAIPGNTIPDQTILLHFGITSRFTKNSPPIPYFTMDINDSDKVDWDNNKSNHNSNRSIISHDDGELQKELEMMAFAFCEDDKNVRIKYKERTVRLAGFFQTYRSDYCSGDDELLPIVQRFLRGEKKNKLERLLQAEKKNPILTLFEAEDWVVNAGSYNPFDKDAMKSSVGDKNGNGGSGHKVNKSKLPQENSEQTNSAHLCRSFQRGLHDPFRSNRRD